MPLMLHVQKLLLAGRCVYDMAVTAVVIVTDTEILISRSELEAIVDR